nr:MAG: zinc-binding loop region of homing endonuclease [Bacteriophage sp.]
MKYGLRYEPETGLLIWVEPRAPSLSPGDIAGSLRPDGYIRVTIDGKQRFAHRLAFELMGVEVPRYVDHINGDRSDNRWANLRPATSQQNSFNRKCERKPERLKSGKWRARFVSGGKRVELGIFNSEEEARGALLEGLKQHQLEFYKDDA